MNHKLKESFDQIYAQEELKDRTRAFLAQKTNGYTGRKLIRYPRFIPAALCIFLILIGGHWLYFTPTAKISIDINPSIEFGINRFDKVVSTDSYNDDGRELLHSLNLKYMDYTDAIREIMENENIIKLLSQDEIMTIAVIDSKEEEYEKILSNIKSCTGNHRNTHCYFADSEDVDAAHDMGLSYGKYKAFLELQSLNPDITPEEVQGMTMREIRDLIIRYSEGNDSENSDSEDSEAVSPAAHHTEDRHGGFGHGSGNRHRNNHNNQ